MSLLSNAIAIPQKGGYDLTDSVRFRSSASAYLSRTPSSAGNRKTFTFNAWIKKSANGVEDAIMVCRTGSSTEFGRIVFNTSDKLDFWIRNSSSTTNLRLVTTKVFRDPSAWYHIIFAIDTTQSTASDRAKLYVNGTQETAFDTATYPTLNQDLDFNTAVLTTLGVEVPNSTYFDGYMTEVNFVDGQALTASDFGEYDATTGVWKPKRYTGTYGTNGFYLPMNGSRETYTVDYLVIAGGGGGGGTTNDGFGGGGGGAGGYLTSTASLGNSLTYTITVGAGGAGGAAGGRNNGTQGQNSSIAGTGITTITSIGGGYGGGGDSSTGNAGGNGGSGGGAATLKSGGTATSGQGNNGGTGNETGPNYGSGGGGGASTTGAAGTSTSGGNGGAGLASSITGSSVTRAGGGGGGTYDGGTGGSGGTGGGGAGKASAGNGTNGTVNTGGGGGGGGANSTTGGAGGSGGSGIVILRMLTSNYSGTTTGSPTITTDGSYTVLTYTSSGSYTG
jgi:hypothetical protein